MPSTFYPSNLQWVGAAKETTYGVAVAAPSFWIPIDGSSTKYKPDQKVLTDQAFRGLMSTDFQQVAGMRVDTLAYKTYCYMDSIYQHLLALFGRADALTGTADPVTHKTSVENGAGNANAQPPSYTLFYFDGKKCWQIPGCIVTALKISVKTDELISVEPQWMGLPATQIATPANTPSTSKPMPSWNSTISIGGSALSQYSEVTLDYKREVDGIRTINASQGPIAVFGGGVSCSGTLLGVYQGGDVDINMTDFLANTQPALSLKMAPVGDATHSLTLQHSVVAYDSAEPQGSNKWMEIQSAIKAIANATDALDTKQSMGQAIFISPQTTAF